MLQEGSPAGQTYLCFESFRGMEAVLPHLRLLAEDSVHARNDDDSEQGSTAGEACPDQHAAQLRVLHIRVPHERAHWNLHPETCQLLDILGGVLEYDRRDG